MNQLLAFVGAAVLIAGGALLNKPVEPVEVAPEPVVVQAPPSAHDAIPPAPPDGQIQPAAQGG